MAEGTGLQVLETSQGGFHPAAGARCYDWILFLVFLVYVCYFFRILFPIIFHFWVCLENELCLMHFIWF